MVRLSAKGQVLEGQLQDTMRRTMAFWGIVGAVGGFVLKDCLNTLPSYRLLATENASHPTLGRNRSLVFLITSLSITGYFGVFLN